MSSPITRSRRSRPPCSTFYNMTLTWRRPAELRLARVRFANSRARRYTSKDRADSSRRAFFTRSGRAPFDRPARNRRRTANSLVFFAWQHPCPVASMAQRRKNPHAMALGRLGGLKGGRARAEKLSARRRREIARQAAIARWSAE